MLSNFDALIVITSNPSLKDESIYHAEQLKTEIRKTNGMKVIKVKNNKIKIAITITTIMITITVAVMVIIDDYDDDYDDDNDDDDDVILHLYSVALQYRLKVFTH